ncbi:MAG TPA: PASTA domain-containing protein [Acidimicrobiia bacterium]|nr:PASTA domain-containing protein [Acidimicrobiia bacterium]
MPRSVVHDLAGRVLAGRYLLQSPIGTGASGRVYAAEDTRLRRRVAVKVLHAALADDAAFLRRFRAEAQVAASLHHPHIVTVHDWGEDDVPFMVQELLEGGSLRSMLDAGNHLSVAQAARVGRDVASALDYAHARGILHRDIKPANLLFDEHGIVRVADFGLARALAEASWTEPSDAVFGTARYASPEQAMGAQLDARSDLYALSLVIVEAVTGRVPFTADTTIGMLTARTQKAMLAPEELGPLVPVLERAGRIDPDERYPDAATMRSALNDVAESLPPPAPLTLAGMNDADDPHPTRMQQPETARTMLFDQDTAEITVEETPAAKRRERRLVPFVVAAVLVLAVAFAAAAISQMGGSSIEVPGLVGLTVDDAKAAATDADLSLTVAGEQHAPDPAGTVISQDPEAGSFTGGDDVSVVVSSGPPPVAVPTVVGQAWDQANAALVGAGFTVDRQDQFFDDIPADNVASVDPAAGAEIAPGSKVTVVVSKGHAPVAVPPVVGKTFEEAQSALTGASFTVKRADEFSDDVESGKVIESTPAEGGEAPFGSEVTLAVSKGPELVAVPDVRNLKLDDAASALEDVGLQVAVNGPYRPGKKVVTQTPSPGTQVRKGETVSVAVEN